jgi:hypothetical protein
MNEVLLYLGSVAILGWGIAHIVIPTRAVVEGFGPISQDNRRILLMEWITEGLALGFVGVLVALVTALEGPGNAVSTIVYRVSALMLLVMAGLSLFTGARTSMLPFKLCPPIFTGCALLFFVGSLL